MPRYLQRPHTGRRRNEAARAAILQAAVIVEAQRAHTAGVLREFAAGRPGQ